MSDDQKKAPSAADIVEELNEDFDTFESWVVENWRIIAVVCVAAVVAVAAIGIGIAVSKSMDRKTAQAFATADGYDKLVEVLKAHPNATFAPDARMKLAMLQLEKKDYAGALANFKAVGDSKSAVEALRGRASLNIAYILELQGKTDEAITAFSNIGQSLTIAEELRFEANYGAGRLLVDKKDFLKAKSCLAKATSVRPRSMGEYFWSSQAKSLLDRALASIPAAAAPAAPAPVKAAAPAAKPKG